MKNFQRTMVGLTTVALATLGFLTVAPTASAHCTGANVASSCYGHCTYNVALSTCASTGYCSFNVDGYCSGGCYLNAAGGCYGGSCDYNVGGSCYGSCEVNVLAYCSSTGRCDVNVVLANCYNLASGVETLP